MTNSFDLSPIEKAMQDRAYPGLANRGAVVRGVLSDVSAIYTEGDDETQIAATLTAHFADADMLISSETIAAFAAAISTGSRPRCHAQPVPPEGATIIRKPEAAASGRPRTVERDLTADVLGVLSR